ncbi:GNAT family N-acetyltransferase [Pseudorhodoferax sp.]|uniref:GNAT family N-acetyltransferase n=1 Tax=Pseudorhodoferax sp. TaxID=1993553 RepID=UPI002DD69C4D|nr:GNAT family N-acetyltransferase [Pseudorhodoferax sp.]
MNTAGAASATHPIRIARAGDAAAMQAIYAQFVRDTAVSLETEVPSVAEMQDRISSTLATLPWLVALDDAGHVGGYVYASRFAERPGYRWTVTVSAYLRADQRGRGLGRRLYDDLLARLAALGYAQACAIITLPNTASVALHETMGFTPVGVFRNAGHKQGGWHDVGWWQRALQPTPLPAQAPEPKPFNGG